MATVSSIVHMRRQWPSKEVQDEDTRVPCRSKQVLREAELCSLKQWLPVGSWND